MERYEWIVSTKGPDGHALKHLDGGTEDDEARAVELAKAAAEKLRAEGRHDWYVGAPRREVSPLRLSQARRREPHRLRPLGRCFNAWP